MGQAFLPVILLVICTNTTTSNLINHGAKIIRAPVINQTVSKGSIVTLPCQAEGQPQPEISWQLDGVEIKNSDRFKLEADTGALTIMDVDMTDEGRYECTAWNREEDQVGLNLIIQSKTTIMEGPKDQNVVVFSSVIMNCSVVADMTQNLTVMWKKNNVDLGLVGFSKSERINTDENYALRIKNVTFDDSGVFTCIAETMTSQDTAHGELTVEGIPPLLAQPNWPADQMEGSVITLTCTVLQGYPAPDIAWYKDGHSLTTGHSLHIPTAQLQHSGDYTCQAHNTQGSDSVLIPLRVRRKTRVISLPIQYEFKEGQDIIFNCKTEVDEDLQDSLKIHWFKGEERLNIYYGLYNQTKLEASTLTKHSLSLLLNASLLISGAQYSDLGHYSCEVLTSLQPVVRSYQGEIFTQEPQLLPLVIFIVVILAIIMLLISICITCHRMGNYGVHHAKTLEEDSIITGVNRFPVHSFSPTITKSDIFKNLPLNYSKINSPVYSVGSL